MVAVPHLLAALAAIAAADEPDCTGTLPLNLKGMVCVQPGEMALFIDQNEATHADYRACVRRGVCPRLERKARRSARLLLDDVGQEKAHRYCVWAGKRLATRAEWHGAVAQHAFEAQERPRGLRCAADAPVLYRPPYWHQRRRPRPPRLEAPTPAELAVFADVRHDDAVKELATCRQQGNAGHHCRDKLSYIASNEGLRLLFANYIKNLGGGYVGIGSDQAYDFIAEARSRWAWLFDYDPAVVHVHLIARAVLLKSPTPQAFVDAYSADNEARTRRWIRRSLDDPQEARETIQTFDRFREELHAHYSRSATNKRPFFPTFGWLANEKHYRYVRTLYRQGRILIRRGNLLTDVVMPDIARSARALGVPVRVYYDSNAADMWPLTDRYRENVSGLPFDDQSVALRTLSARKLGIELEIGTWIYVVHGARHLQRALRRDKPQQIRQMQIHALPAAVSDRLTLIGLPQALPERPEAHLPAARIETSAAESTPR